MNYTVLLGEVIEGEIKKEELNELKKFLFSNSNLLDRIFEKSLKVKTTLKKLSFQAVFDNSVAAFLYYRMMKLLFYPLEIKVGLGEGKLYSLDLDLQSEGPAHFHAYRALGYTDNQRQNLFYLSFSKKDKYLNSIFRIIDHLERKTSISSNLIKLIGELYFPIFKKDSMSFFEYQEDFDLRKSLEYKEKFYNIILKTNPSIRGIYPETKNFNLPKLEDCQIYDFEDLFLSEKKDLITCFWKSGFSTKIANSLNNMTRQNVDKHLEGGIILLRNLEGGVCLFLSEKKNEILL